MDKVSRRRILLLRAGLLLASAVAFDMPATLAGYSDRSFSTDTPPPSAGLPDPATLFLIGSALAALAIVSRKLGNKVSASHRLRRTASQDRAS